MRLLCLLFSFALPVSAMAASPRVVTDIAPVEGLVARIMEGVGVPERIVATTPNVHSHNLRPSEAARLESADVVFWIGEALTPWMERPIETLAGDARVISLLDAEATHRLDFREEFEADDHDNHDHGHDHGAVDPHAWLDPENAVLWSSLIAEVLSEVDPENAVTYRANAEAARGEIEDAVQRIEAAFGAGEVLNYAVFHDAYQYYETRFGLRPVGAVTLGDAVRPGPAALAELHETLANSGTTCLLAEPQESGALLKAIARDDNLKVVRIAPLGPENKVDGAYYVELIEALAESFLSCRTG